MTPEQTNLLSKIVTETATAEDFFSILTSEKSYKEISHFILFDPAKSVLKKFNLETVYSTSFRFYIRPYKQKSKSPIYDFETNNEDSITRISCRGKIIYWDDGE
jgi:hypothetical protein